MKTVGDYYSVIQQAEKTYTDLGEIMKNYPKNYDNTDSFEYLTLQQTRAYIRNYIDMLKKKEVVE